MSVRSRAKHLVRRDGTGRAAGIHNDEVHTGHFLRILRKHAGSQVRVTAGAGRNDDGYRGRGLPLGFGHRSAADHQRQHEAQGQDQRQGFLHVGFLLFSFPSSGFIQSRQLYPGIGAGGI